MCFCIKNIPDNVDSMLIIPISVNIEYMKYLKTIRDNAGKTWSVGVVVVSVIALVGEIQMSQNDDTFKVLYFIKYCKLPSNF